MFFTGQMGQTGRFSVIVYSLENHSIIQGYPDDLFLGNVQCHLHYQAGQRPRAQSQSTSFHQTTSRPRCPESLQPMPLFLLTIQPETHSLDCPVLKQDQDLVMGFLYKHHQRQSSQTRQERIGSIFVCVQILSTHPHIL